MQNCSVFFTYPQRVEYDACRILFGICLRFLIFKFIVFFLGTTNCGMHYICCYPSFFFLSFEMEQGFIYISNSNFLMEIEVQNSHSVFYK